MSSAATFHSRIKALLVSTRAVVYVDDVLIEEINHWEHDKQVKKVMEKLAQVGMHVNAYKLQCGPKKVMFLGYDISASEFS